MNRRASRFVASVAAVLMFGLSAGWDHSDLPLSAAEPVKGRVEFDRVDIPADHPAAWPKEINRMAPVARQEFISLIEKLNRGVRSAWLKSAHYEATLINDTLHAGLMTASVQRLKSRSRLLDLGTFSLALDHLKWQDREAVWGTAADGHSWLFLDGDRDELLGEWSCRGREFSGGIDFDLQLPAATVSILDLRVPKRYSVYAPAAEVTLLSGDSTEDARLWRIQCGSDTRCRVTFVLRQGVEDGRSALLVEHDLQVVVREDDVRFQLNLYLDALDAAVQDLTLKIPTGVVVYSATYGVDTPIAIQRSPDAEAEGRLPIRLPGPLSGRKRTLRIDGIAVQKPGQPTAVPQITVENSLFDGGHLAVTIQSPLQLRSLRAHGYRQRTTDGESLSFQQLLPNSQLILDVHRPQISLSGRMACVLDVDEETWNLTTEVVWSSQTAGAYQTTCIFPAEWEVADVRFSDGVSDTVVSTQDQDAAVPHNSDRLNWNVQPQAGGKSLLSIEFFEAIQPRQTRTVRIQAQRRPPPVGQSDPVPLPQLVNCDVSEVLLGIQTPNSMTPVLSSDSRLERISSPTVSLVTERPNSEQRWYRADSMESLGSLQLKPRLQPVEVRTETVIEAFPTEYRIRYAIEYDQVDVQADRLLVYLTEAGPDVRWTWKNAQPVDLTAARLPKSQHVEWNLPAKGELWEIRLPRGLPRTATIEGLTNHRWSVTNRPALPFVPQAVEKLSELRLLHPETLDVLAETDGLRSSGKPLTWWYVTPQVQVDLALRNPEPTRDFPLMVSMQLRTLMSADVGGYDLYRARLQLENGSSSESLRIKLDSRAIVQEALVGGESIATTIQGGEFVVPGLNATRRDTVELVYRVPAQARALYERRQIIVPKVSAQVLSFFWEFGVPPSARIFAEPGGIQLTRSLPTATWKEHMLGPLGRGAGERIFNPLRYESWVQLLQPPQGSMGFLQDSDGELVAPVEWQVHQAALPDVPAELWVGLWNTARTQLLAWIILGVCLATGVILRMVGWVHRDLLAAYWLGLSLAGTLMAVAPYAEFLGASVAGALISLLIPRHLVRKTVFIDDSMIQRPRSHQGIVLAGFAGILTFAAASGCFEVALAQEAIDETGATRRPAVYVPVDADGQPSQTLPLVYVPRDTLARWKSWAGDLSPEPKYLISQAQYNLDFAADGNLNLSAHYRVHVLRDTENSATIGLPLADVTLPDADSCLVNGQPHAVSGAPNGKGYLIELQTEPSLDRVTSTGNRGDDDGVTTYEIELRARKTRPAVTNLELRVPIVASSQFVFRFPDPTPYAEVIGRRGALQRDAQSRSVICDLGATASLQARWGTEAPKRKPAQVAVSSLQHLEIRPAYSELYFHCQASIEEGSIDTLEFNLPQNAIVRKSQLRTDDLLRSDVIVTGDGQRRLRLVFDKSRPAPLKVDGVLVLLQRESLAQSFLPDFGVAATENSVIQVNQNWWGVSTLPEFRLETANLDAENVTMISSDAYLTAWVDAADPRHPESMIPRLPQATFEGPNGVGPTFLLIPNQPHRKAVHWKQTGFLGKRKLEWTLVGEIETSDTPTFQTVLLVDRRLRIEDITVFENDAKRRFRWTESRADPSRVVLLLNERTKGKQTITLHGSLPMTPGIPVMLPNIRPEDCEVLDARIALTRDPEIDVAFNVPREWKNISAEEPVVTEGPVALGSFQIADPTVRATVQTSSRHSRCSCKTASLLRRVDGMGWQLKSRIELTPEGDSPLRVGLMFPAVFTDPNSVTVERAEPVWHEVHEGARQLDLLLSRGEGPGNVVVQFETILSEPKLPDWELPFPSPLSSSSHEIALAIEPGGGNWFPGGATELRIADLPEWASAFYAEIPGNDAAFKLSKLPVRLQRDVVSAESRDASIRLLDHRMWLHSDGRRSGITQSFLSSVRNELVFEVPPHIYVTSLFLDEQPVPLAIPVDGHLKIPMTDAGTESLLTITWVVDGAPSRRPRSEREQFLWPIDVRIDRNLVTILPDDPMSLVSRSGLTELSSLDQGLDRLETLLERHAALGEGTRGAIANRWLLDQLQSRLATRIPVELRNPGPQSASRVERWNQLIHTINELEPVPPAPPLNWHARLLQGPVTDSLSAIRGRSNNAGQVMFWQFDRRIVLGLCSMITALFLIPILRRSIRVEWSRWLHRHVLISWFLLAIVWWLFLTPSALGPILLVIGLIRAATQSGRVSSKTSAVESLETAT